MTRVLICEDSKTYGAVLRRSLERDGDIEVIGVATTGEQALEILSNARVDVVTMDIELPGMSGLEAVEQIMGRSPCPILIISSHLGASSQQAAAALAAGALDAESKDDLDVMNPTSASATALRARVRQISHIKVIRHPRSRLSARSMPARDGGYASVVGICASTGGPQALRAVLSLLPATYAIPILVVQHISMGFGEGLARWLDDSIPMDVRLASDGDLAVPGVWIAPHESDLQLGASGALVFDRTSPPGLHRPSGDALLKSLAERAGSLAVAVVLSGMGRDGASGARSIRDVGGIVLAQDEESSAVYGMPKVAAIEAGATVLTLGEIAARLAALRQRSLIQ